MDQLQEPEAGTQQDHGEDTKSSAPPGAEGQASQLPAPSRNRWFGRGIYGSKDVPIRLLNGLIGVLIAAIIIMIVYFAIHGGYRISFDTDGGNEVAFQKIKYGELVEEPEIPEKPGYEFLYWFQEGVEAKPWDFAGQKIVGDMTLVACWTPAKIRVKFDLNGGITVDGSNTVDAVQVIYGEKYGELPIPVREGFSFEGWEYSGALVTADTAVKMTGEHVLTAVWKK